MLEWGQTPFTLCLKAFCQFECVFEWGVNLAFRRRTCFVCCARGSALILHADM
ncbi:hypothetical protein HMPREF3232_01213 [Fannyhessea vaginae]|nr:hypothetical protein HMPREF3232_01213 [Fannyhessea vaginae]